MPSSSTRINYPKVPVTQLTGVAPQVMINVLRRSEARTILENSHILQGTRVIIPIDNKRSAVIYSNNASDWNIVAAVAKLHVTTDALPFLKFNLPKSFRKLLHVLGLVVFWVAFLTMTRILSIQLTSHILGAVTGRLLPISNAARSLVQGQWTLDVAALHSSLAQLLRAGNREVARFVIASLEACIQIAQGTLLEDNAASEA